MISIISATSDMKGEVDLAGAVRAIFAFCRFTSRAPVR